MCENFVMSAGARAGYELAMIITSHKNYNFLDCNLLSFEMLNILWMSPPPYLDFSLLDGECSKLKGFNIISVTF